MNYYRVLGSPEAVEQAMDQLHVHTEVQALVEIDGGCEVYFAGHLPALVDVQAEALVIPEGTVTGLEDDGPIWVSEDLVVRPPWVSTPPGYTGVELVVPRAMAFGSGEHGSTQAALQMLHRLWRVDIGSVGDVGTGSGILLQLAATLGRPRLYGCDVDEVAVVAARDLLPTAEILVGGPSTLPSDLDVVIANMRWSEIEPCLDELLARWNRRGPLVLAGDREVDNESLFTRVGRPPTDRVEMGGFVACGWSPLSEVDIPADGR